MDKRIKYLIIGIVLILVVISVGTYAWLTYRTNNTAMTLTIGEIDKVRVTLSPYQFNGSVKPLSAYSDSNNKYVQISATNKANTEGVFSLYYHINSIASELRRTSFKYTILRSTTTDADASYASYKEGNFSTAVDNTDFTILAGEVIPGNNMTYYYRVYVWINNSGYQSDMQGKIFDAELTARISNVPSIYQQVEYLESSGTQYIDTGFVPNQDTRVVIEAMIPSSVIPGYAYRIFGARNSSSSKGFYISSSCNGGSDCDGSARLYSQYSGSGNNYASYILANNVRYVYDFNKNVFMFNGNILRTYTYADFTADYNAILFGANSGGNINSMSWMIYYCKLYDNGILIRDFIPVYRKSDSAGGMYDAANNVFYTNSGSGTFTYGNNL